MRKTSFYFFLLIIFLFISCLKRKEVSAQAILAMVKAGEWGKLEQVLEKLKSKDLNSLFLYVYCLGKLGKFEEALEVYDDGLSKHQNKYFKLLKAEISHKAKKVNQARKILLEIIESPNFPYEALKLLLLIEYQEFQGDLKKFLRLPQINKLLSYQNELAVLNILALRELLINSDSKKSMFYLYKAINLGDKGQVYPAIVLNFAIIADKYLKKTQTAKFFYKLYLKNNFGLEKQKDLIKQRLISL